MHITTSKKASRHIVALAKSIATALPGIEYIARSGRPLGKIAHILEKKARNEFLVLVQKEGRMEILRYEREKDKDFWKWNKRAILLQEIWIENAKYEYPVQYCAKKKGGEEALEYIGVCSSPDYETYDENERTIFEIGIEGGELYVKTGERIVLKARVEWVEWKKE